MKILIIQITTLEIKEYSEIFLSHNSKYAIKNGYHYLIFNEKSENYNFHPSWIKIACLENINYSLYDYIWVLDADCLITNQSITLEEIINKDPTNIIISENGTNGGRKLNAGSFIVKGSFVPTLFHRFKDYIKTNTQFLYKRFWEQEMINDWYEIDPSVFSIRNMNEINSHWMSFDKPTNQNQFVNHVMNCPQNLVRIQRAEKIINKN